MNFLKRRFSDLGPNLLDTIASSTQEVINQVNNPSGQQQQQQQHPPPSHPPNQGGPQQQQQQQYRQGNPGTLPSGGSVGSHPNQPGPAHNFQHPPTTKPRSDLSKPGAGSAPSSPPEQRKMQMSAQANSTPQQQPTPSAGGGMGGFFSSLTQKAQNVAETAKNAALPKIKILLVIDDPQTDWNKYFRGRKLYGDYDIRVEQAEFAEISVKSHSDTGATVEMHISRGGPKVVRTFRPDFVLVRQQPKTATDDFTNLLIALQFGSVPSVNSLNAVYNFQSKPWTFSQLVGLQKKLGKEKFPLIEQVFYPTSKQMTDKPRFPVVLKVGHEHGGVGKVRVDNGQTYEELCGLVQVANTHCTSEPFIDSKFDFRVQKIGNQYKVYMRTSSTSVWKSNLGSAVVEQVNMNDTFRMWMDQVCDLFGGLDMCAISALRGRDNKDYIIEVNDCCMPLIGDKQEEDKRAIADLVLSRMDAIAKGVSATPVTPAGVTTGVAATGPPADMKHIHNDVGAMPKQQPPVQAQQYNKPPTSGPIPSPQQQQPQQQQIPQRPSAPSPAASSTSSGHSPATSRSSMGGGPGMGPQPAGVSSGSSGSLSGKQGHQLPPTPQASALNYAPSGGGGGGGNSSSRPSSRSSPHQQQQQQQHRASPAGGQTSSASCRLPNYYVAGGYSTVGAQYAASGATFRLSRFGRKVVAVARLKKMADEKHKQGLANHPGSDLSKGPMGNQVPPQGGHLPGQPQHAKQPVPLQNQPPKSSPNEPSRSQTGPMPSPGNRVPSSGPMPPPPRQQPTIPGMGGQPPHSSGPMGGMSMNGPGARPQGQMPPTVPQQSPMGPQGMGGVRPPAGPPQRGPPQQPPQSQQMPPGGRMNGAPPPSAGVPPPTEQPDDASIKKLRNAFSSFFE
ncbi:synapsin-2-like isoform X2 [Symsagittifera roscoffensis]|uniref:synapsin-2-like isoform X2 n=1 Tax=Symsagittifera roscoffensis TaxID=84072 RepID=UPI00307BE8C6